MKRKSLKSTKPSKTRRIENLADTEDESLYTPSSIVDSDLDSEMDPIEHDVKYKIQSTQSTQLMDLIDFFKDNKMINAKGDPTTNIIDRLNGRCYNVPERRIPKM